MDSRALESEPDPAGLPAGTDVQPGMKGNSNELGSR